jgi:L-ornithine N5-monooxygenase
MLKVNEPIRLQETADDEEPLDVLGIGFGPANVSLAVMMEELGCCPRMLFLERNAAPAWQPGMLLDGSDIQNNPFRDLITPVNPRSEHTFLNFLSTSGRLLAYLNLGVTFPLRKEYALYIRWVAEKFNHRVAYNEDVEAITVSQDGPQPLWTVTTSSGTAYRARTIVVGTGRRPRIPRIPGAEVGDRDRVIHLTEYLERIRTLDRSSNVVVLGASQSAVELVLDLTRRGYQHLSVVHRGFSFQLKDTSPFSEEVFLPGFVDYYHSLPKEARSALDSQVRRTNYSSVDRDVLDELYRMIYEDRLDGRERVTIYRNHEVVRVHECDSRLPLVIRDVFRPEREHYLPFDLLILATGFLDIGRDGRSGLPHILREVASLLRWDGDYLVLGRDYRAEAADGRSRMPDLYFNGLCESTHGMGDAGSFSLLSLRAKDICESIMNRTAQGAFMAKVRTR